MRKLYVSLAVFVLLCAATAGWWNWGGGQHWLAVHTGTDYCPPLHGEALTTCRSYGFWSGFGSVYPYVLLTMGGLFAGLAVALRRINCHEPGCWRMGRYHLAGGEFVVCGKHNPDFEGKHAPRGDIARRHEEYRQKLHLYLGDKPGKG